MWQSRNWVSKVREVCRLCSWRNWFEIISVRFPRLQMMISRNRFGAPKWGKIMASYYFFNFWVDNGMVNKRTSSGNLFTKWWCFLPIRYWFTCSTSVYGLNEAVNVKGISVYVQSLTARCIFLCGCCCCCCLLLCFHVWGQKTGD